MTEEPTASAHEAHGSEIVATPGQSNNSQALFRLAKARSLAARRYADESAATAGDIERRNREIDACTEVIILTQAALESAINWTLMEVRHDDIPRGWIARWEIVPGIARRRGLDGDCQFPAEHLELLREIGAWRNYFLHGDRRARERLDERLSAAGKDLGPGDEVGLLTAAYAAEVMTKANELFRWSEHCTGIQMPFVDHAWVAPDEH